jgi:hypothetical protein
MPVGSPETANQQQSQAQQQQQPQQATAEDKASGNFIEVGFRRTQDGRTLHMFNHAYIGIPDMKNGIPTGTMHYYEVLGNQGSTKNQQVRDSTAENRHDETRATATTFLKVTPAQKEALSQRLQYFSQHSGAAYPHPCPSCSPRYHSLEPAPWNSNTFVYNMLIHNPAGRIEPPRPPHAPMGTPGYYVNAPLEHWY